jgi:hypothetical protein
MPKKKTYQSQKKFLALIEASEGDSGKIASVSGIPQKKIEKRIAGSKVLSDARTSAKILKKSNLVALSVNILEGALKSLDPRLSLKAACYTLDNLSDGDDFGEKKKTKQDEDTLFVMHRRLNDYLVSKEGEEGELSLFGQEKNPGGKN